MLSTIINGMVGETSSATLAEYLQSVLEERQLSMRALAVYAGISHSTVRRVLAGEEVDHKTLAALAEYLNIPIENVYRMAGLLPEEDLKTLAIREVEHLLRQLPPDAQRKILDMIRLEHKYYTEQQAQEEEETE